MIGSINSDCSVSCYSALGVRNPLVQGVYPPGAFGLPPPGVNGELAGAAAAYGAGLHLVSPQMNGSAAVVAAAAAAAAAGYGRSPVVRWHFSTSLKIILNLFSNDLCTFSALMRTLHDWV